MTVLDLSHDNSQPFWDKLTIEKVKGVTHLVAYDIGDHIELELLVVDHKKRGRGIGTEMVKRIQSLRKPIHLIAATWGKEQKDLVRFYEHLGFTAMADREMLWAPTPVL